MCGVSLLIAPSSAALNFELLWIDKPVEVEYPYRFGLNSFRMLGSVKYSLQVFSPPMENETPVQKKLMELMSTLVSSQTQSLSTRVNLKFVFKLHTFILK